MELVVKARKEFSYDGNKMFLRDENLDELFYIHSSWLFKNFNKDKLNQLKVGQSFFNSSKTRITRIY